MAQFPTTICLVLLATLSLNNLYASNGDEACYRVVENVPCQGADMGKYCLPECVRLCGQSTLGVCVQPFPDKYVCACEFVMPDCNDRAHRPC